MEKTKKQTNKQTNEINEQKFDENDEKDEIYSNEPKKKQKSNVSDEIYSDEPKKTSDKKNYDDSENESENENSNEDSDDKNAENEDKDDKNKNAKYLMDDDDEELLEQKKFKCNKCKKEMKEKNFPYHLLSEHKIIPEKQKESSIRLYIKKKIETIKNMYVDISDIKNYKTEKGENLTKEEKIKLFKMTDELEKTMLETFKKYGFQLNEKRTNIKKKPTKKKKIKKIIYYEEEEIFK